MTPATWRAGLKTALETIDGLHVYAVSQTNIDVPAAAIVLVDVGYNESMSGATTRSHKLTFSVVILVGRADDKTALDQLDNYIGSTGTNSIKAAIESDQTLGAVVDHARVVSVDQVGEVHVSGTDYLGAEFIVEVYGS